MKKKKNQSKSTRKSATTIFESLDSKNWVSESTLVQTLVNLPPTESGSVPILVGAGDFFTLPIQVNERFVFTQKNGDQPKHVKHCKALFELEYKSGEYGCVVNVTVKINFISGSIPENQHDKLPGYRRATADEIEAAANAFQQGITATWSDKFKLCFKKVRGYIIVNGANERRERYNTCCPIRVIIERNAKGASVGVFAANARASSQFNWNLTDPGFTLAQTAAHESGHFFGNTEEYGETTEVKGPLNPYGQMIPAGNNAGSVMGDAIGKAFPRHFWRILKAAARSAIFEGCTLEQI